MKESTQEGYGHVLKYTGIFGGVQGLNLLVGLVRNKLIAVILGPEGMGLASLFNTSVTFMSQSTNLGIPFSAVRQISELADGHHEEQLAEAVSVTRAWSLLTALAGMVACVAVGPLLSSYTFSWGDHTLHFILLAPAIGMLAVTGGETAILKGTRQLRSIAMVQLYTVFAALLISIPVYYFFGQSGIVPVIVLMAAFTMAVTLRQSLRLFPFPALKASASAPKMKSLLGKGMGMLRLGVAFTLAGVAGSAAEMFIRSFLNVCDDLDAVGLYNAGYTITVSYAALVFSAMESDYFPRLSATGSDRAKANVVVCQQIEVSLLVVAPMVAALVVALPVLIPLLFSAKFVPVIPMAQVAALSVYFKAVTLPVAYITLARGLSKAFLCLESAYYVVFVLMVIWGYSHWGLMGAGAAITLAHVFDWLMVWTVAYRYYGFRATRSVYSYMAVLFLLGLLVYAATFVGQAWLRWTLMVGGLAVSTAYSFEVIRGKTKLWNALVNKVRRKIGK